MPELLNRNDYPGPICVSFGGGTNSLAVLIAFKRAGQRVDLITFSDTKGEKPETYRAVEIASDWCVRYGYPAITTVRSVSPEHGFEGLEGMVNRLGTLPSKAFGFKTCSQRYKIEPNHKYLNSWKPARESWARGGKVLQVIGIDAGEAHRAKDYTNDKFDYWYPLIDVGWSRDECIEAITSEGLPLPGKSACFFCPSMRKQEIIDLSRNHPDLFNRALDMERRALASGKLGAVKGLGRHWSWEELVSNSTKQGSFLPDNPVDIDCSCYDGDSSPSFDFGAEVA